MSDASVIEFVKPSLVIELVNPSLVIKTVGINRTTYTSNTSPNPKVYREAARFLHAQPYFHVDYAIKSAYDKVVAGKPTPASAYHTSGVMLVHVYLTQFRLLFEPSMFLTPDQMVMALLLMAEICENP